MTPRDTSLPIGIYVRVSRKGEREDEKFHSPKEQAERATALVLAQGLTPGPVFEDIDVSGAKPPVDRPAMSALLAKIKAGELGGIAAFSLDRLSREPAHGDALVRAVTKAGGVLLTPDIPDAIDSPTGEFTFGMLLQVAKLYRSTAKARFQSAKERATLAGIPIARYVPFGYRRRDDRRLEVDPALVPAVRNVFERRAAGAGYTEIANLLGEATGRRWTLRGAAGVIQNRLYVTGRFEYGGIVSEWDAGAIVDEALWHAAQRKTGVRPKREVDSPWLLTGVARCASCDHSLGTWSEPRTRADKRRNGAPRGRRYRCVNRSCSSKASVEATQLERLAYLQAVKLEHELSTRTERADLTELEEALIVSERRLTQASSPEAQDALGDAWVSTVKARRQERDAAARALGEARAASGDVRDFRIEEAWDGLGNDDRRAALALFWRAIRVGRRERGSKTPLPVTFVARAPHAETELEVAAA